ncbi:ATP-grasp domain-containing protein [Chromobacterium phragmitis]|uniref:ATP-grasp domain-containing protein n=1 Tax=Chromobacterium phragmitis TaxID=2202141 RepID=A0A344UN82_9NEIS|nr:ATP-grasp domain-containing protein [Chromobacterium phragmitis]
MPLPCDTRSAAARHVLILGARAPACLEWARCFHAAGWQVTIADSLSWPVSRASRSAHRYARLPEPRLNPARWLDALRGLILDRKIDLVLPTCEEAFYLASGRGGLPCRVLTSDFDLMHRLHHKYQFARMSAGWAAPAPETRLLESQAAVMRMSHAAPGWVFKPVYSRFASRALLRPSAAQLKRVHPTPSHPWVAQRYVPGKEHCSYSLLVDGRLTAHACYHPRHRVGRGSGIWFEPTDPAPIRAFVEQFGAATGYNGQVGFDFIETQDGCCRVLECNPRATSGVHLFSDQPLQLIDALLGNAPECAPLSPTGGPSMVGLAMLLFAAPRRGLSRAFWKDFAAARDVLLRKGDPGPLPAQLIALLEIASRALLRRRGLLAAATADIEWDGDPMGEAR